MEQKITENNTPMENETEFAELYDQLTDEEQQEMLEYMHFLLEGE